MKTADKVKDRLRAFRSAISTADGEAMAEALSQLDCITREEKGQLDPRLQHFLERRSYEKAWEWLENNPSESND